MPQVVVQRMSDVDPTLRNSVLAGLLTTLVILWLLPTVPAVGLAAGMVIPVVTLLLTADGRKRYALVGTAYLLILGVLLGVVNALSGLVPNGTTLVTGALVFGLASLLVVAVRSAGRALIRTTLGVVTTDTTAERVFDAGMSILSAIGLLYLLSQLKRKVLVHGSFVVGGSLTFGLSLLGRERTVSLPGVGAELEIVLFLFIGTVLAGFYTFDSLNSTYMATKSTAKKSLETGKQAHAKTSSLIDRTRNDQQPEQDE